MKKYYYFTIRILKNVNMKRLLYLIIFSIICFNLYSQNPKINLNDLIAETQLNRSNESTIKIAWWIPVEFWKGSLANQSNINKSQSDEFIEALSPYVMFAIIEGKVGPFGGISYVPFDTINKKLFLITETGEKYYPLSDDEISSDVQNLLLIFKPVLQNLIGQMGQNMHFFVFNDFTKNNNRICDPFQKGRVHLYIGDYNYAWKTPLGSLLPPKYCPVDNEKFSGAYEYCPWHGNKLETKEQ